MRHADPEDKLGVLLTEQRKMQENLRGIQKTVDGLKIKITYPPIIFFVLLVLGPLLAGVSLAMGYGKSVFLGLGYGSIIPVFVLLVTFARGVND